MNCSWCGLGLPATLEGVAIDHIIPRARGGPDTRWNKQLLHEKCNMRKGDKLTAAAEALARAHEVVLREPGGRYRMATPKPKPYRTPSEIKALQQLLSGIPARKELQAAINDVFRHMKFPINDGDPRPGYAQLAAQLREKIKDGVFTHELPPYTALANLSGLSMSSVQHAVRVLADEGLVTRVRGRGVFIQHGRNAVRNRP